MNKNNNQNTLEEDIIASQIVSNLFKMFPDKKRNDANKKVSLTSKLDNVYNKYGTIQKNLIKQESFYYPFPPNSDSKMSTESNKKVKF